MLHVLIIVGQYEFVKKGDPAVMGITKMLPGVTLEDMKRPRVPLPLVPTPALVEAAPPI